MKKFLIISCLIALVSCTVYTEKRSEALSQAVYATATSITNARFDFAARYAEQAKRLAYAPKKPINVSPILTSEIKKIESINKDSKPLTSNKLSDKTVVGTNVITTTSNNEDKVTTLRLVIPEFLKNAKLLIENSDEWNELLKTKEIKQQLEQDNANLKKLAQDIDAELAKQEKYNSQMVDKLNKMQTEIAKKNLLIWKLYVVIAVLIVSICGGIYLRMKGVL